MNAPPDDTRWVIIGAGFAGAATAWALGRAGLGPGVVLKPILDTLRAEKSHTSQNS